MNVTSEKLYEELQSLEEQRRARLNDLMQIAGAEKMVKHLLDHLYRPEPKPETPAPVEPTAQAA